MKTRFCQLFVVLVFAITMAVSLARTQTTQTPQMAYAQLSCCPPVGACNAFCDPLSLAYSSIVTPSGQTDGPYDMEPTWSADGTRIAFARTNDIFVAVATGGAAVNITNTANNW